jgi:hypothetical protein
MTRTILSVHATGSIRWLAKLVTQDEVTQAVNACKELDVGFHHDIVVKTFLKSQKARRWDNKLGFGDQVIAVVHAKPGVNVITTVMLRDSKYPPRPPRKVD